MANVDPVIVHETLNTVVPAVVVIVLGLPVVQALLRRLESRAPARRDETALDARLQHIEIAVDAIAVEVERLAEGQRFALRQESPRMMNLPVAGGAGTSDSPSRGSGSKTG